MNFALKRPWRPEPAPMRQPIPSPRFMPPGVDDDPDIVNQAEAERLQDVLGDLRDAIRSLRSLPEDWNSYGARRIDADHVDLAIRLVGQLMRRGTPFPSVVPTSTGGVQIEWHCQGFDIEVETIGPDRLRTSFFEAASGREWEVETGSDWSAIARAVDEMTRRARRRGA